MEEREGVVQSVEIRFEGEVHRASYFVEYNVIHASIGGRVIATPVGNGPVADTVKALLLGQLLQRSRKMTSARLWLRRGR
jgi:hypothetical protein